MMNRSTPWLLLLVLTMLFLLPGCVAKTEDGPAKVTPSPVDSTSPTPVKSPAVVWVETTINNLIVVSAPEKLVAQEDSAYVSDDLNYVLLLSDLEDEMPEDPWDALELAKDMTLETWGATLEHSERTTLLGGPALRFGISVEGTGHFEVMALIFDENKLVNAFVKDGDYERFFDSLRLVSEAKSSQDL